MFKYNHPHFSKERLTMADKSWPDVLNGIKQKIAADSGIKTVTTAEIMSNFAVDNLLLPFMSFEERLTIAHKCGTKIGVPSLLTRLRWGFKPFTRRLTRRGRAADRIIRTLTKK